MAIVAMRRNVRPRTDMMAEGKGHVQRVKATTVMAFPIPSHLPRRAPPQDVSSSILNKIDAATNESLNATLASSWIQELNDTIYATKVTQYSPRHTHLSLIRLRRNGYTNGYMKTCHSLNSSWSWPSLCRHVCSP